MSDFDRDGTISSEYDEAVSHVGLSQIVDNDPPANWDILEVGYGSATWLGIYFEGQVWPNPLHVDQYTQSHIPYELLQSVKVVGHYQNPNGEK